MMAQERSFEVRSVFLGAILRTGKVSVLAKLMAAGSLLVTLDEWVKEAEQERQTTFLRLIISALGRLPILAPQLRIAALPKSIMRLQKFK